MPRGLVINNKIVLIVVVLSGLIYVGQIKLFVDKGLRTQHIDNYVHTKSQSIGYAYFYVDNKEYKNLFNVFYTPFGGPTDYLTLRQRNAYASLAEHQVFQKGKIIHSVNNFSTNHAEFNIEKPINGEIDIPVLKTNNKYIVRDNGKRVTIKTSDRGSIEIDLKKVKPHSITVDVRPLRCIILSIYISVFTCSLLILIWVLRAVLNCHFMLA